MLYAMSLLQVFQYFKKTGSGLYLISQDMLKNLLIIQSLIITGAGIKIYWFTHKTHTAPPDGTIMGIYNSTSFIMNKLDLANATRLDLEIWDTQNKIKYIKLPTRHARKSELILSQTKGVRTNTNRGKINSKMASII